MQVDDEIATSPKRLLRDVAQGGRETGSADVTRTRILVAGADMSQNDLIRRALELDGFAVDCCESGREAVTALVASPPDLLLVNTPLRDGAAAALLRWTRARRGSEQLTCMVMAPPSDSALVADLYDAGADFVITRRTEIDLLSRKVAAALARRPVTVGS